MAVDRQRHSITGLRPDRLLDQPIMRLLGRYPSRHVMLGSVASLLLACMAFTVWLLMGNTDRIVQGVLVEVANRVHNEARREIRQFLSTPDLINRNTVLSLEHGRVHSADFTALQTLFWDVTGDKEQAVSAIYFGNSDGAFSGVDSPGEEWPPTVWRYILASRNTGGQLVFLDADEHGRITGLPRTAARFDPRTRPWYIAAAARSDGAAVWTDIYANFADGVPTLTRAQPVRDSDAQVLGVAGVDLNVRHLQRFLRTLTLSRNGEAFIVEADGTLIASHTQPVEVPDDLQRHAVDDPRSSRFAQAAGAWVRQQHGGFEGVGRNVRESIVLDGEAGYLMLSPAAPGQGLDWVLGVFVPERDYVTPLTTQLLRVVPLGLLGLLFSLFVLAAFARLVSRPLSQLRDGAKRIAVGEFDVPIDTDCQNEVGDVARAIDDMRRRLKRSFEQLRKEKLHAKITLDSISDGVIAVSATQRVRYMNRCARDLLGCSMRDALGRPLARVFDAYDESSGEPLAQRWLGDALAEPRPSEGAAVLIGTGGRTLRLYCRLAPVTDRDGSTHGAVLSLTDLSEELRLRTALSHQATHDPLTGLNNRAEFERCVERAVENARDGGGPHALCYLDLDQFKVINDNAGHDAGDALLRQVAVLLGGWAREGDTLARLGGDEFGALLKDCSLERASAMLTTLRQRIARYRFGRAEHAHSPGISAGLTAIDASSAGSTQLMRDADSACYIAKCKGSNRQHVHRDDDTELDRLRTDRGWVDRILQALHADRLTLYAQPIESANPAASGSQRHLEILLRVLDASGSASLPAEFFPAAERFDLAARLDRWVVRHTIDWLTSPERACALPDTCSINLSGQSLSDDTMLPFLIEQLERSGVDPTRLCFEITETAAIADLPRARALIDSLRERGCRFALDDFGSGLSSFAYLKTLPVDYLKIDGQFVRDMLNDRLDFAMVRSINEIGQAMGVRTIAEYVQSEALRTALHGIGVDLVQGYGTGAPVPLAEFRFRRETATAERCPAAPADVVQPVG